MEFHHFSLSRMYRFVFPFKTCSTQTQSFAGSILFRQINLEYSCIPSHVRFDHNYNVTKMKQLRSVRNTNSIDNWFLNQLYLKIEIASNSKKRKKNFFCAKLVFSPSSELKVASLKMYENSIEI